MDEIRFEIDQREDPVEGSVGAVSIFVNGRDLTEIAREIELPSAAHEGKPDIAGSYVGLKPEAVFLPSRRLLGRPEERYADRYGKIAVLGCGCGVVGCWPLLVSIAVLEDEVFWNDFEQPHRGRWRYDALGPFVFDRSQYLDELQRPGDHRKY
ncbi:MAG: hypothetical protein ACRDTR_11110 [Rubrobacter sp.]